MDRSRNDGDFLLLILCFLGEQFALGRCDSHGARTVGWERKRRERRAQEEHKKGGLLDQRKVWIFP
jgi:uncharacterized protein HemY